MSELAAAADAAVDMPPSGDAISSESTDEYMSISGDNTASGTTDEDMPDLPTPVQAQSQPKKKRYAPPKADTQTFRTQQEFLESLQPMPVEDVEEDKRKCPICWKHFGEPPDPGFDNSELPVKLRCNHIFGHKCLATTFALPKATHLELQALSFGPDGKGRLLAEKLVEYFKTHESNLGNETEIFDQMLQESCQPCGGIPIFGKYWWPLFNEVIGPCVELAQVTLLENAIIIDYKLPKGKKPKAHSYGIGAEHLTASSTGLDGTLANLASVDSPLVNIKTEFGKSSIAMSWSSSSASASAPTPTLTASPNLIMPSPMSSIPQELNAEHLASSSSALNPEAPDISKTWQMALANQTNLDKLSGLQKKMALDGKKKLEQLPAFHNETGSPAHQMAIALPSQITSEVQDREAQREQAAMERNARALRNLLAEQLATVLAQYKSMPSESSFSTTIDVAPRTVRIPVSIHLHDLQATSHTITSPMGGPPYFDDDDTDDEEEEFDLNGSTMVVKRKFCPQCCRHLEEASLPTPTKLTWRNHRVTPDDCPLCHRVLFKKNPK